MERTPSGEDTSHVDIEKEARKRVKELKEFYHHAAIYVVVNAFLLAINVLTSPGAWWALWPIGGWGVGLLVHAVSVYGLFGIGSKEWENRKVRELVLQNREGLTAEEVRNLLRDELHTRQKSDPQRIIKRLENLEAIVTSQDWDHLTGSNKLRRDTPLDIDSESSPTGSENEVERLARRVR